MSASLIRNKNRKPQKKKVENLKAKAQYRLKWDKREIIQEKIEALANKWKR